MTQTFTAVKGRFGFYPCDYETFLKVKKLHSFYWKALRRNAEFERWCRKAPQNRVIRKWFRDEKGRKTGSEIVGPKPEPKCYPIFHTRNYVPQGFHALEDMGILQAYQSARTPREKAEDVAPLNLSVEKIDKMLAELEAFEATQK
jgi:hypothetical protein